MRFSYIYNYYICLTLPIVLIIILNIKKNRNSLAKEFLFNILKNSEIYKKYLPDRVKYETLYPKNLFLQ